MSKFGQRKEKRTLCMQKVRLEGRERKAFMQTQKKLINLQTENHEFNKKTKQFNAADSSSGNHFYRIL